MDLQAEKLALIRQLTEVNDIQLLEAIKKMVAFGLSKQADLKEGRTTLEQYNAELDAAEEAIERGEFFTHDEVKKQMQSW